jgi:hypothetical protein
MARIPIEQESKSLLWPWVVGLIALLGVLWGILAYGPEEPYENDAVVVPSAVQDSAAVAGTTSGMASGRGLTTSAEILNAADPLALVGREVRLEDLRVARVLGDSTFYVALEADTASRQDTATRQDTASNALEDGRAERLLFVVLDEQATPNQPQTEGRYDVNAGQTLTIYGTMMALSQENLQEWGITPAESQGMEGDLIYVRAQRLEIMQRP